MPLDVQPLSLTRRICMVVLMLALLGGSLGFAQWLIIRQPALPPAPPGPVIVGSLAVTFLPPAGLETMPVNTAVGPHTKIVSAPIKLGQGTRKAWAFCLPAPPMAAAEYQAFLGFLLDQILPAPDENPPAYTAGTRLGGFSALQAERHVGRKEDSTFAIIRLVPVNRDIVAFCLSGDGLITDADRQFFDLYCTQKIEIMSE